MISNTSSDTNINETNERMDESKKTKKKASKNQTENNSETKTKARMRIPFSSSEDQRLIQLVKQIGIDKKNNWHSIAKQMEGRTVRQCRERYQLYLSDGIKKKEKWTKEEDDLLLSKYSIFGPKWKKIEGFFVGRTSYNIKNRFISLNRKINKNLIGNQQKNKIGFNNESTNQNILKNQTNLSNNFNQNNNNNEIVNSNHLNEIGEIKENDQNNNDDIDDFIFENFF